MPKRLREEIVKYLFSSVLAVILLLGNSYVALAQNEVTLLAPRPIMEPLEKLIQGFEAKTTYKVKATWGSGLGTKQQVAKGEAQDVSIMFAPFPEALASGNVDNSSAKTLARLILALAVKKGAPSPDISTPEAVKRTLLAAKSIISVDPAQGSAGVAAVAALEKLGIADQVKPKMKFVPNGGVVQTSVAKGEVEIALGPYVSDMSNPDLDVVGPLPREASTPTDFVGFISTHAKNPTAAKLLLDYLTTPQAGRIYRQAKMEPAH
jgi:molybdate transport system substrate-binding protein